VEEELADLLTAEVEVRIKKRTKRGESGELAIHFGSIEALNGLIERIRRTA
jgi:ParB family chromosome partitioning protein